MCQELIILKTNYETIRQILKIINFIRLVFNKHTMKNEILDDVVFDCDIHLHTTNNLKIDEHEKKKKQTNNKY